MYLKAGARRHREAGRLAAAVARSRRSAPPSTPRCATARPRCRLGWTDLPFDIPHFRAENGPARRTLRIGWLRSVANIYHAFGVQSFIDELAHAAGTDPVDYFLARLGADRKLDLTAQGVEVAGQRGQAASTPPTLAGCAGWCRRWPRSPGGRAAPGARGWGFAAHRSFLSYIAHRGRSRRRQRAASCASRGCTWPSTPARIVHPDRVTAQFEGAAVFGTSVALFGEVTAAEGRVTNTNFNNYPVARIDQAPREVHVHFVGLDGAPSGVGEPGVPPMAPAICNAIFAATGTRVRELPVKNTKLV